MPSLPYNIFIEYFVDNEKFFCYNLLQVKTRLSRKVCQRERIMG